MIKKSTEVCTQKVDENKVTAQGLSSHLNQAWVHTSEENNLRRKKKNSKQRTLGPLRDERLKALMCDRRRNAI